jgi:Putative inner membrane protein (DUF1819)
MPSRSHVVSSFTIVKGALIEETYSAFAAWDERLSRKANLDRLKADNTIRATSETWLRDVAKVLNRRFDPSGRDHALVTLAKARTRLDVFKPILLWHTTRDEFLLRDFLIHFLYPRYASGSHRVDASEVESFVASARIRGGRTEHGWSAATKERVAVGLLRMATDFDLLRGKIQRAFVSYHLPDEAFLYLLHALHGIEQNAQRTIHSDEWKMYYMSPADVERELFRLHQFRRLEFQVAGSLAQLTLPCASAEEFAERMVA